MALLELFTDLPGWFNQLGLEEPHQEASLSFAKTGDFRGLVEKRSFPYSDIGD